MAGLGIRLRQQREKQGLGVVELGELAGVDGGRISELEAANGLAGVRAATVIRLASALGVRVGWLLCNEWPPEAPAGVVGEVPPSELAAFAGEVRAELRNIVDLIKDTLGADAEPEPLASKMNELESGGGPSKGGDGTRVPVRTKARPKQT